MAAFFSSVLAAIAAASILRATGLIEFRTSRRNAVAVCPPRVSLCFRQGRLTAARITLHNDTRSREVGARSCSTGPSRCRIPRDNAFDDDTRDILIPTAELLASTDGESDADVEAAWAAEIEKRIERVRAGEAKGRPWSEVRDSLKRDRR